MGISALNLRTLDRLDKRLSVLQLHLVLGHFTLHALAHNLHVVMVLQAQPLQVRVVLVFDAAQVANQVVNSLSLLLHQAVFLPDARFHILDDPLFIADQLCDLRLLELDLLDLQLVGLADVLNFHVVLVADAGDLLLVLLNQRFNLLCVALMDLWRDLVANEFVQVLNLLEDSALHPSTVAGSTGQFVIALVILAPAIAIKTRAQVLNDGHLFLELDLQALDREL